MHGQGQKREQKPTTKKFVGFHNHSPLITMLLPINHKKIQFPRKEEEELSYERKGKFVLKD